MTRIAVVGAGLLGRTLAVQLIRRNYKVTLFDRDFALGERSCAYTGAGMLAPYCELDVCDPLIFALGEHAVSRWSSIVTTLPEPVFMQDSGTLVVAHNVDSPLLQQFYAKLTRKESSASGQVVWLNTDQLSEVEPAISGRFDGAYFAKTEGQIDNRQLLAALAAQLNESDCTWLTCVQVESTQSGSVLTDQSEHKFDLVIDCRGMGAREQLPNLRAVRGEIVGVHSAEIVLSRPVRVLHPRYAIYVVPRPNQNFLIGATSIESEDYSSITVISTLELLSAVFSLNPAFASATIVETRVNCRPALPDNLPMIRVSSGLIEVNGLYRHGFLVAPKMVAMIIDHIEGQPCEPRFQKMFRFEDKKVSAEIVQSELICT